MKILGRIILILVLLFVAIQLIPYGRDHTNPPVQQEPQWDKPETRQLAKTACFDCHSNETIWPWYSNIAPASWLVYKDVAEGRETFNFSEWHDGDMTAKYMRSEVEQGKMPPPQFLLLHPEANLSPADKNALLDGLEKSIK